MMVGAEGVENRRVEIGMLDPHPENYRQHPARQIAGIRASLHEFGQPRSIVVQEKRATLALPGEGRAEDTESAETRYTIVAGHGVVEAAKAEGWTALRCDVLPADWAPQKVKAYLVADNELGRLADNDDAQLAALIEEARAYDDKLLAAMGYDAEELGELLKSIERADRAAQEDPGPQIDKAEELRVKWGVNSGDLWACGDHRIICGDCTDAAVVARVMGGEKADMVLTDPPYNIGYQYDVYDDAKSQDEYANLAHSWFDSMSVVCQSIVVTPGRQNLALWLEFSFCDVGCWVKSNAHGGASIAHSAKWEPILFFGKHKRSRDCDVFEHYVDNGFLNDESAVGHVCPKPMRLWDDLVTNYSDVNAIIYEPFSGSGTSIIACEQAGRRCRAVEISAAYTAVALQRFFDMTGKTPVLIESKQEDV